MDADVVKLINLKPIEETSNVKLRKTKAMRSASKTMQSGNVSLSEKIHNNLKSYAETRHLDESSKTM